jgi:hypothetical protein
MSLSASASRILSGRDGHHRLPSPNAPPTVSSVDRERAFDPGRGRAARPAHGPVADLRGVPDGPTTQHLHAGPSFADAVAAPLGIALLEAPADWSARLPDQFTRRSIHLLPIRDAWSLAYPIFAKSSEYSQQCGDRSARLSRQSTAWLDRRAATPAPTTDGRGQRAAEFVPNRTSCPADERAKSPRAA